uniref:Uncharacterized protein n=1 Tax=Cacopsylla melanoneura TaxID=428564 RepID=A0A8D8TE37_9HEMI
MFFTLYPTESYLMNKIEFYEPYKAINFIRFLLSVPLACQILWDPLACCTLCPLGLLYSGTPWPAVLWDPLACCTLGPLGLLYSESPWPAVRWVPLACCTLGPLGLLYSGSPWPAVL